MKKLIFSVSVLSVIYLIIFFSLVFSKPAFSEDINKLYMTKLGNEDIVVKWENGDVKYYPVPIFKEIPVSH